MSCDRAGYFASGTQTTENEPPRMIWNATPTCTVPPGARPPPGSVTVRVEPSPPRTPLGGLSKVRLSSPSLCTWSWAWLAVVLPIVVIDVMRSRS